MKKIKKKIIAASLVSLALIVVAADYGRFLCNNCSSMPPSQEDIVFFVRTVVNYEVKAWVKGDSFALCNGSVCQQLINETADAKIFAYGIPYPDPRAGYKREGSIIAGGGGNFYPGESVYFGGGPSLGDGNGTVIVGAIGRECTIFNSWEYAHWC
ncbi:hypothetical protein [Acidovorax sp. NCPPB 3576]|uniref:hypothetical protein n=1 Tax=Acidovorax sp. NCPPB 3576 TaxID=2940488 RepID=UPI002349AB24|nr:hypothetical protein [Acidovorax sp. NCPPB 3576]WCM89740.1 hypothetical protein M5C98_06780 [Acidovorax sp. NCPPB 3576]